MRIDLLFDKYSNRVPSIIGEEKFAKYAVFLPVLKKGDEYHILFEVRALHMRRQPGEVCFPGGKVDKDDVNSMETALRETREELGIQKENIQHIFPLDYIISPYGTIIYPYAGLINEIQNIQPNPSEVAEIFTIPLSFFENIEPECFKINFKVEPEKNFPFHLIIGGENYNWQTRQMDELFYYFEDKTIWGLTATILNNFINS
ncbi:NUDIX hydrolase, partial [Heyndrickxia sporothermodurans]